MPDDDRVIEDAVVRISPDLTGFKRELDRKLRRATAGANRAVTIDVNLDSDDLDAYFGALGRRLQMQANAQRTHYSRMRSLRERFQAAEQSGWAANEARERQRTRSHTETMARIEEAAYAEGRRRAEAAQNRLTRIAAQGERERERVSSARSRFLGRDKLGPSIIDWGGKGIRPMNALLLAAAALSPALIAVASSAVQASTAVAALGAAGIGAAAGITAVVVGFGRIREALKLREQLKKQDMRGAGGGAAAGADTAQAQLEAIRAGVEQVQSARRSLRDANRSVADSERNLVDAQRDALEARKEINAAYTEAANQLKELRELVSDLALQESGAALDVSAALERQAEVNRNFWATDLERAQAAQEVAEAQERLSDTQRERTEKTKELQDRERKGLGQSEEVVRARERVADADRGVVDAQLALADSHERVADAQKAVARAQDDLARTRAGEKGPAAATAAIDTTANELARLRAEMSPAARAMDDWFASNERLFTGMRKRMEQAVLPGFLVFLQQITARSRGTKSTLDILADSAASVGKEIGDTAGELGKATRSPWFRSSMLKINKENAEAFDLLGKAVTTLLRPLMRITAAASPLFTRFSGGMLRFAQWFDSVIEKAQRSGDLAKWFKQAGDELGKWVDIGKNLTLFLLPIFTMSLPTGRDLVTRIRDLTATLAGWSNSPEGQRQIREFFELFKAIDYGKLRDTVGQIAALAIAWKAVRMSLAHPFLAMFALLAKEFPATTAQVIETSMGAITGVLGWVERNPVAAATLLAILGGLKGLKTASTLGLTFPGLSRLNNSLASRFKPLEKFLGGGAQTGVMTVQAGVVNITGGFKGGVPPVVPGGPGGKPSPGRIAAVGAAAIPVVAIAAATGVVFELFGKPYTWDPVKDAQNGFRAFTKALEEEVNIWRGVDPETDIGWTRWFSTTLPDQIRMGLDKGSGGWSGLWDRVRGAFGQDTSGEGKRKAALAEESAAFNKANGFISRNTTEISKNKAMQQVADSTLRAWLVRRRESIAVDVATARANGDEAGAQRILAAENEKTRNTLISLLRQTGMNKTEAARYASQVLGVKSAQELARDAADRNRTALERHRQESINARKRGDELATTLRTVEERFGPLTSKSKKITLITDGEKKVFSTLEELNAYQQVLRQGLPATQANLNKQKKAFEKNKAAGGPIIGAGTATSDSIPARLSNGEHVWTAKEVQRAGGHGAVENMRRAVLGFAEGGGATLDDWPYKIDVSKTKIPPRFFSPKSGDPLPLGAIKAPSGGGSQANLMAFARLMQSMGARVSEHPKFGGVGRHAPNSRHYIGQAIDVNYGPGGQNATEMAFFDRVVRQGLHRKFGLRVIWRAPGHFNHAHYDYAAGGAVRPRVMDTGGTLYPGQFAVNNSRQPETIRTSAQEKALRGGGRLDRRDLALLAQYIVGAVSGQQIVMDGRAVAQVVAGYDFMPRGAW